MKVEQVILLALALTVVWVRGSAVSAQQEPGSSAAGARAQVAVEALQQWYAPQTGLYRTTGWWNSANAITALANFSRESNTVKYLPVFANTLRSAQRPPDGSAGFINKYYDDEGWWALAWIDVYDLTHDSDYLHMADAIFSNMQLGWETATCGGGVWWSKDNKDKNAIENELFLAVAASLANRDADATMRSGDLEWARREWSWFRQSGMINGQHLVNDGLDLSDPAHCRNNRKQTWSYNQGVILGALVELDRADPDPGLKRTADSIGRAAIAHLTDRQGILRETSNAHTGGDVPQFKGIFARNLMILNGASPDRRFVTFIHADAQSAWNNDRNASNQFGFWWGGPFDAADAARQSSVLDLLVAAETVDVSRRDSTRGAYGTSKRMQSNVYSWPQP
ncbi:MAG: glycoside hydrolase family 76 protein [Terracidiphilus sp.]